MAVGGVRESPLTFDIVKSAATVLISMRRSAASPKEDLCWRQSRKAQFLFKYNFILILIKQTSYYLSNCDVVRKVASQEMHFY